MSQAIWPRQIAALGRFSVSWWSHRFEFGLKRYATYPYNAKPKIVSTTLWLGSLAFSVGAR